MTETLDRKQFYNAYLDARTGKYSWRCQRYDGVIEKLYMMGLRNGDSVVDIGAGREEFHKRLQEWGWEGNYIPLDASIDGIDLNEWSTTEPADFFVAIEFLEHIHNPFRLMQEIVANARKGVAATTPNPKTTDVLGMDATHVIAINTWDFAQYDWNRAIRSFYGQPDDSILAWKQQLTEGIK